MPPPNHPAAPTGPAAGRRVLRMVAQMVLVAVAGWLLLQLLSGIDWASVGSALTRLRLGDVLLLVVLVIARQVLSGLALMWLVPGLSLRRSVQSDFAAFPILMIAPSPSDMILRSSMFTSWGLPRTPGLIGLTLHLVGFYAIRLAAPVAGLLILLLIRYTDPAATTVAVISGALCLALVAAVILLVRADRSATFAARLAARLARRAGRRTADPDAWAQVAVEVRGQVAGQLHTGWARATLAFAGITAVEATILVVAIQAAGAGSGTPTAVEVIAAFLIAYVLTLLPLFGVGIFEVGVIALLTVGAATGDDAAALAAGLIIWRAVTLLVPLAVGLPTLALWRRTSRPSPVAPDDPERKTR